MEMFKFNLISSVTENQNQSTPPLSGGVSCEGNMKTLEEWINKELDEFYKNNTDLSEQYPRIQEVIKDDTQSVAFIRAVLNDDSFGQPEEDSPLFNVTRARARHSVLTFFIGLVFAPFENDKLFSRFSGIYNATDDPTLGFSLWLNVSLNHDKGYYDDRIFKLSDKVKSKYDLLTDDYPGALQSLNQYSKRFPGAMAYSYADILQYEKAAMAFHVKQKAGEKKSEKKQEMVDHGILGGRLVFDRQVRDALKAKEPPRAKQLLQIKTCALTIAQHNMFKSATKEDDAAFPNKPPTLRHTSKFKISPKTPLLLFLSLIDTFECVKKFSKSENDFYLQTLTVLSKIKLSIDEHEIRIDYSELHDHILSKRNDALIEKMDQYFDGMKTLGEWTDFATSFDEKNFVCTILLTSANTNG